MDEVGALALERVGEVRPGAGRGAGVSVWQLRALLGEDLVGRAERRRRGARDAGDAADVGGDVLGVLAGDDVGRHVDVAVVRDALFDRPRALDLALDDALDRVGGHPVGAGLRERRVEVGTDVGARPGLRRACGRCRSS